MRNAQIAAVLIMVILVAGGSAAAARTGPHPMMARGQQISQCFIRHNWILSVDTPVGGYAYVRGGGVHFQQWVSWWLPNGVLTAVDSGLLTNSEERTGKLCAGPTLNP